MVFYFYDHPKFPDEVTSQFFGRSMSVGYHLILFCEQGGQEPKRAGFAAISMGQPPAREREHFSLKAHEYSNETSS